MQKKITVKPVRINDEEVLGLFFPYDGQLMAIAKKAGAKWSQSKICWWMPNTSSNFNLLFEIFKGIAWLDITDVKRQKTEITDLVKVKDSKDFVPEEYRERLQRRRYSKSTVTSYCSLFNEFLKWIQPKDHTSFTEDDIRKYQTWLVQKKKVSISTQNSAINAIKFYLEKVEGGDRKKYYVERPRKEKKLPVVLSEQEVFQILNVTSNPKHRLVFSLLYSTGMRISELIGLRIQDVDIDRGVVHIKNAKGKKDRITTIGVQLIPLIRDYLARFKPNYWFFEGPYRKRYSASSIRATLGRSVKKAGILKHVTPHTFRHSYATHLLEQGTDTRYIQELLGHNSIETTAIYAKVSNKNLQNIRNPLDRLMEKNRFLNGDSEESTQI